NHIYPISPSIHTTIKQRPPIFFKVQTFFYSHFHNALNLLHSYTPLPTMPPKSQHQNLKLQQTPITLDQINRTLIPDLKTLNQEDYQR
ncbi:5-bromo-4-chloroindolyl phosphate hydrolysis family protein, partial [Staphylococcus epidermidis]|uniref:5-bromo-4-chloroindolyl phosphate hydrolysis family protein n=1 Tax=Staphylococcus epidermidis TaxID=1282 RepID=UPI001642ECF6